MKRFIIFFIVAASLFTLSACQVLSQDRTLNQFTSDAAVTANVKAELLHDSQGTSLPIHVETDKGMVVLSGFVKTLEQKTAAGRAAESARGVRAVRNNLIIRR